MQTMGDCVEISQRYGTGKLCYPSKRPRLAVRKAIVNAIIHVDSWLLSLPLILNSLPKLLNGAYIALDAAILTKAKHISGSNILSRVSLITLSSMDLSYQKAAAQDMHH